MTDGQTDSQTDGRTESIIAKTALCIASYADAQSKINVHNIRKTTTFIAAIGWLGGVEVRSRTSDSEVQVHQDLVDR